MRVRQIGNVIVSVGTEYEWPTRTGLIVAFMWRGTGWQLGIDFSPSRKTGFVQLYLLFVLVEIAWGEW